MAKFSDQFIGKRDTEIIALLKDKLSTMARVTAIEEESTQVDAIMEGSGNAMSAHDKIIHLAEAYGLIDQDDIVNITLNQFVDRTQHAA